MTSPRALALFAFAVLPLSAQEPTSRPESRAPAGVETADRSNAETYPYFARTLRNEVNVRGGASDAYSPVARLKTGQPVRVLGRAGEWFKVEIAGGLALWAAASAGGKTYIEIKEPGLGVVVARDLQLRGTPDTNEPSLGELKPGDEVEIVSQRDSWANILVPKQAGYVSTKFLRAAPDAKAAEAEFNDLAATESVARRSRSSELENMLRKREIEAARLKRAETAMERFAAEKRKPAAERDVRGVQEALEVVVSEAPAADDAHGIRAQAMLDDLRAHTALEDQLRKAKDAQAEAERKAKESQLTYERDLEALRKRKEDEAAQREGRNNKYIAVGFVRLAPPIPGAFDSVPKYAIQRGNQREFHLVSDKYTLSDYVGKHVGILEAEPPEDRPGAPFQVLRVKKLEILAPQTP